MLGWSQLIPIISVNCFTGRDGDRKRKKPQSPWSRWVARHVCSPGRRFFSIIHQTSGGALWNKALQSTLPARTPQTLLQLKAKCCLFGRIPADLRAAGALCTEGVGCALAGTRPGSGAAEIIPSTPCARGSTRLHNKRTAACLNTKHAITFVSRSTESHTARCACVRFKINVH